MYMYKTNKNTCTCLATITIEYMYMFTYNSLINKRTEQPGKPKAPDTESHIPVSEQKRNTNSREDSFGAILKPLERERRNTMTERMIENRIKKLSTLEEQIAQLQAQADAIKSELKADLEEKGLDELRTKNFLIRWKEIVSNRLNGKALKAALPEIYNQFCEPATTRRFTVA